MESGILASHYNSPGSLSLSLRRWPGDGIRGAQNKMLFRLPQFRDHMFIMADLSPMTVYIHWVLSTYLFIFIYFRLAKCKSNWYKNYAMSFTYWIIHSQNDHKQYPRNTDAATRTGPDPTQSLISFQCPGPGPIHNRLNSPSFHPEFVIVINHLLRLPEMLIVMKPGPRGGDVDVDGSMFYVFLFLLYISFP